MFQQHPPIALHRDESLSLSADGWQSSQSTYFIKIYGELVSSGLLAEISGNSLKILLALGLSSSRIGVGTEKNLRFFEGLKKRRIVSEKDRKRLFCYLRHDDICTQTGLSKNTVTEHAQKLVTAGLIEKRVIKNGAVDYNIYFIRPIAHLDKNNTFHPQETTVPKVGMAYQKPRPNFWDGNPDSDSKLGTNFNTTTIDDWDINLIFEYFAKRKKITRYRPTAHDRKQLTALHADGCSTPLMLQAIDIAFDTRPADAPPIRQLSFCAPIARKLMHASDTASDKTPPAKGTTLESPPLNTILNTVSTLYRDEIGVLSPMVVNDLQSFVAQYPDVAFWEYAFRQAVHNDVRKLSYVLSVLKRESIATSVPQKNPTVKPKPIVADDVESSTQVNVYKKPEPPAITLWNTAKKQLEGQLTRATFNQCLANTTAIATDAHSLTIAAPNPSTRDWLEHRLKHVIESTVRHIAQAPLDVQFAVM